MFFGLKKNSLGHSQHFVPHKHPPLLSHLLFFGLKCFMDSWPICLWIRDLWSEHSGTSLSSPPLPLSVDNECWVGTFGNTEPYKTITQWWQSWADPLSLFFYSPLRPPAGGEVPAVGVGGRAGVL